MVTLSGQMVVVGGLMPDDRGRLTPEDHTKLREWWGQYWRGSVACPVCKTTEWVVGEHVVSVNRLASDAGVDGSPSYQMVLVGCKTCSHTMFFNAVQIGLTPHYDPATDLAMLPAPKVG
jgi:hypothetical protein